MADPERELQADHTDASARVTPSSAMSPSQSASPQVPDDWREQLGARLQARGFHRVGFAPFGPVPGDEAAHLREWLARGYHGTMDWLADTASVGARIDPSTRWPWARTICCATFPYLTRPPGEPPVTTADGLSRVSRYAHGLDYHDTITVRLRAVARALQREWPGFHAQWYIDTGPVLERQWAARCGLGWLGKNSLLLHPVDGSYVFIGTLLLNVALDAATLAPAATDRCGTCTRCIDACPTQAIIANGVVDARRCLSYLTIEHRGDPDGADIPADIRDAGMHGWLFGCDVCQEVCPYNAPTGARPGPPVIDSDAEHRTAFEPRDAIGTATLADLASISAADFRARYRRTPLWRAHPEGLRRSARLIRAHHERAPND